MSGAVLAAMCGLETGCAGTDDLVRQTIVYGQDRAGSDTKPVNRGPVTCCRRRQVAEPDTCGALTCWTWSVTFSGEWRGSRSYVWLGDRLRRD